MSHHVPSNTQEEEREGVADLLMQYYEICEQIWSMIHEIDIKHGHVYINIVREKDKYTLIITPHKEDVEIEK